MTEHDLLKLLLILLLTALAKKYRVNLPEALRLFIEAIRLTSTL